jgi:hypothetical protein
MFVMVFWSVLLFWSVYSSVSANSVSQALNIYKLLTLFYSYYHEIIHVLLSFTGCVLTNKAEASMTSVCRW